MIFKTDDEALKIIKENLSLNPKFKTLREKNDELEALVNGDEFLDLLINKIEGLESPLKAKARKKYSKSIKDLFQRLFQPIDNVYYATGGMKDYNIESEVLKKQYLEFISNVRDGRTLNEWVQLNAIQLMNTDPNGLMFLEYQTIPELKCYPTYKSIQSIRFYKSAGQCLDFILFEPKQVTDVSGTYYLWRIVDDLTDRTFKQVGGDFMIESEMTFEHPFGQVPALLNSNITVAGKEEAFTAIDKILDVAKEYARDQSFLSFLICSNSSIICFLKTLSFI